MRRSMLVSRLRPPLTLAALTAILLTLALPALATESEESTPEGVAQTETEGTVSDYQPAVTVAEQGAEEIVQPWTNRYLIQTMAVLAIVLFFTTVVQYFLKVVKARYKVVE